MAGRGEDAALGREVSLDSADRFVCTLRDDHAISLAAQVEAKIADNLSISETEIAANSCCTLASFNFLKTRQAISNAERIK